MNKEIIKYKIIKDKGLTTPARIDENTNDIWTLNSHLYVW